MLKYVAQRLLWMVPTLFGVTLICFLILNLAPGSPVEQQLSKMRFYSQSGSGSGVTDEVVQALKIQYGMDKPLMTRYGIWLKNIATLNFGDSVFQQRPAVTVIGEKLTVTLQFGIVSLLLIYAISVFLGIRKAVRDGSKFDLWTSVALMTAYSIPPLIFGILLRVLFSSGQVFDWLPLGDLYSDNYFDLSLTGKILDRVKHAILPLACYVLNGFTVLTFLMKNSLLEEVRLDYVRTARAKGAGEGRVIYGHALRNALIPLLTSLGGFLPFFLGGAIIIEQIFNLDGIGQLSYTAIMKRDYNIVMALIVIEALLALVTRLVTDIAYVTVDPRIDFHE